MIKEGGICECCMQPDATTKRRRLGPFVGPPDSYVTVWWCNKCWQHEGDMNLGVEK